MQNIIIPKPYEFIPPHRGKLVPSLVQSFRIVDTYLARAEGITSFEVRGIEHLRESLARGRGILLAPNHCRYADPLAMGWVARQAKVHVFAMASWHLFQQHWLQAFAMRMCGGFSVYREGADRQSLDTAINILVDAQRPLVVFPEGAVFHTNDRLHPLLDGVAFLARSAARRRAKQDLGEVVVHPVGIKYVFRSGDALASLRPVLDRIEARFTWRSTHVPEHDHSPQRLVARVRRLEEGLLTLKELQYLGRPQMGDIGERRTCLIEELIGEVESKWLDKRQSGGTLNRIKQLRTKMVPWLIDPVGNRRTEATGAHDNLTSDDTDSARSSTAARGLPSALLGCPPERRKHQIWGDLERLYVAQQVSSYPVGYLDEPTDMRLLETVERVEEDIMDRATVHRPLHAILQVDEPIVVSTDRPPRDGADPLMEALRVRLEAMLDQLSHAARPIPCQ